MSGVRYSVRGLLRTPSFTLAALLCLALGIGATTAIFSVVNGVLLRPLPYPAPNGLVRVYTEFPTFPGGGLSRFWVSEPEVFDLRKAKSFDLIGAWATTGVNIAGLDKPLRAIATYASAEIFEMLRVSPLRGHLITHADDKPGAPQVLILSFGLWQRAFGGDPNVIGSKLILITKRSLLLPSCPRDSCFRPVSRTPLKPGLRCTSIQKVKTGAVTISMCSED